MWDRTVGAIALSVWTAEQKEEAFHPYQDFENDSLTQREKKGKGSGGERIGKRRRGGPFALTLDAFSALDNTIGVATFASLGM